MAILEVTGGLVLLAGAAAMDAMRRKRQVPEAMMQDSATRQQIITLVGTRVGERAGCLVDRGRFVRGLEMERVTATGRVTPHWGIDVSGDRGTVCHAVKTSMVVWVRAISGYGNVVALSHLDAPESSLYAHLQSQLVQVGQIVFGGDPVGLMGNTTHDQNGLPPRGWAPGRAEAMQVHLHWEIHPRPVPALGSTPRRDPVAWLASNGIAQFCERG